MKNFLTVVALGLCASVSAMQIGVADAASSSINSRNSSRVTSSVNSSDSTSVQNSIISNDSSISSSTDVGATNTSTTSIVGKNGSMCSAEIDGKRCDISCRTPQIAQGGKAANAAGPSCLCQ